MILRGYARVLELLYATVVRRLEEQECSNVCWTDLLKPSHIRAFAVTPGNRRVQCNSIVYMYLIVSRIQVLLLVIELQ